MTTFFSPAKINLFLRVVSKRPDGYHSLSSYMQTISLGDLISIEHAESDSLTCSDSTLNCDRTNLIMKGVDLFRNKTGSSQKYRIHLEKRIPIQAGLGGGSSNAATILWACNQLTRLNVPVHELQKWSAEIGSDIPFFFSQGTAHCTGRGEFVQNLQHSAPQSLWIIKPDIGLSTPAVFKELAFETKKYVKENPLFEEKSFMLEASSCFNDLEGAAFKLRPELRELKEHLLSLGFDIVLMSGSGSSFFCIGQDVPSITIPQWSVKVYPTHFINRHSEEKWYSLSC